MNKTALAASAILALFASASANAQSGTITFNGEVTAVTCDVSINGTAGNDGTVTLDKVTAGSLPQGATGGKKAVIVHVGGSDAQCTSGSVALELNPSRNARVTPGGNLLNLEATTPAANVAIALRDAADRSINVSTPWTSPRVNLSAGGADIPFAGEYIAEAGDAGAGQVNANVQYTLDYN